MGSVFYHRGVSFFLTHALYVSEQAYKRCWTLALVQPSLLSRESPNCRFVGIIKINLTTRFVGDLLQTICN